jgi:hypothetical protein
MKEEKMFLKKEQLEELNKTGRTFLSKEQLEEFKKRHNKINNIK